MSKVILWLSSKERNARIFSDKCNSFDYFCGLVPFTASN